MRHPRLRRHRVLTSHALLLLLHVLLVGHLLLLLRGDSVAGVDGIAARHGGLLGRNLGMTDILRRIHSGFPLHAVLGAGCGLGRIQTCLRGTRSVGARKGTRRGMYLNEVFAFGFGDERLQLGGGKGVDESGFGDHEEEDLGAGQDGKLVRLVAAPSISLGLGPVTFPSTVRRRRDAECDTRGWRVDGRDCYLLHDASLALGEGNVPTRFVLNELDVNLPSLATGLVVVIVIVVGGRADARTFDASVLPTGCAVAVTGRDRVVVDGWRLGGIGKVGHAGAGWG